MSTRDVSPGAPPKKGVEAKKSKQPLKEDAEDDKRFIGWYRPVIQKAFDVECDDVKDLYEQVRRTNVYNLEASTTINVLLLGRARSGKSTATGMIKDPVFRPKDLSIFSETTDTHVEGFTIVLSDDIPSMRAQYNTFLEPNDLEKAEKLLKGPHNRFNINIIDTPGLFESKAVGMQARDNQSLMKSISECIKQEITKLNCIILFCTYTAGINPDDVAAINSFLTLFKGAEQIKNCIALCFTHSEDFNTAQQSKIKEELCSHPQMKDVMEVVGDNVYFTGCVIPNANDNLESLRARIGAVYALRMKLLNYILTSTNQVELRSLSFMQQTTSRINEILDTLTITAERLSTSVGCGQYEMELTKYVQTQTHLLHNFLHMLALPEISPHWIKYCVTLEKIRDEYTNPNLTAKIVNLLIGDVHLRTPSPKKISTKTPTAKKSCVAVASDSKQEPAKEEPAKTNAEPPTQSVQQWLDSPESKEQPKQ